MNPKFSIIIPVYNVAPYLRECLDSVLAQTYTSWEAICVDDGSTDVSGTILDEYAAKDSRFRVIHQANAGVSSARNAALNIAQSEWITFLDADDVIAPWTFEMVFAVLNKYSSVDVVSYKSLKFAEDSVCPFIRDDSNVMRVEIKELDKLSLSNAGGSFWCRVFRREVVGGNRFKSFKIGEDTLFLVGCMLNAKRIACIDVACHGYRQRSTSVSHSGLSSAIVSANPRLMNEFFAIMENSSENISYDLKRCWINSATEGFCYMLWQLPLGEQRKCWYEWKKYMLSWGNNRAFDGWQKLRLRIFLLCPLKVIAYLLFVAPAQLKHLGIHR